MKEFEFLEHTADLKFRAYGKNLEDCFTNSARALFTAMLDLKKVDAKIERGISIKSETLETLLHDWLSELLFLFETENFVPGGFEVRIDEERCLMNATLKGEKLAEKHKHELEVKAVTYHDMIVREERGVWIVQVVCDT